jgi:hypothetical protein
VPSAAIFSSTIIGYRLQAPAKSPLENAMWNGAITDRFNHQLKRKINQLSIARELSRTFFLRKSLHAGVRCPSRAA